MKDVIFVVGAVLLIVLAVFVLLTPLIYWWNASICDAQWVDFEHRYGFFSGCMVEYEGTRYPDEVVRAVLSR